jgi:hypothetical protein
MRRPLRGPHPAPGVPRFRRMDRADVGAAGREVERVSGAAARRPWVQRLARAGFFSRAAVYGLVGLLALAVALGRGGRATDSRGALAVLARAPLGGVLLGAVAVGLAGLALWFIVEALADPDARRGVKGAAIRIGKVGAGLAYGSLAFFAFRLLVGAHTGPHGNAAARSGAARALDLPGGPVLVAIVGVAVMGVGGKQIWRGVRQRFTRRLDLARMGPRLARWARGLGTAGFVAQGTIFGIVGVTLVRAALAHDAREARGFDGALAAIARQPEGATLLAVAALGLLAYAAFAVVEGRYRRL